MIYIIINEPYIQYSSSSTSLVHFISGHLGNSRTVLVATLSPAFASAENAN